jgi:predicted nuclease of predicted toxin-antitoxin system
MKLLLDENMSDRRLAARLRALGHDPTLAADAGLLSVTDARVLIFSIAQALPVLTQDSDDFEDLHDLIMAASGHHAGIMIVRFDNDGRHNLTDRGISTALSKLESSGVQIAQPSSISRVINVGSRGLAMQPTTCRTIQKQLGLIDNVDGRNYGYDQTTSLTALAEVASLCLP